MHMSVVWLRVAVVLYGASALAAAAAALREGARWRKLLPALLIGGLLFHFVSLVDLLNAYHHWVPVDLHGLESLFALILAGLFCWSFYRYNTSALGVFVLPMVFLLTLSSALGPDFGSVFAPRLRTGWVLLHIALMLAAYSALLVSLLSGVLYLIQEGQLKSKHFAGMLGWLPSLETTNQISYRMLLFGFPCMTLGLLIGSLLAEASTGPAYFRDPKVLLSFAMWVFYVFLLWVRRNTGIRGRRALYFSGVVIVAAFAVWAANAFSSVHRYVGP
jgi:ABC-type uncharacterized transport system permease subunit